VGWIGILFAKIANRVTSHGFNSWMRSPSQVNKAIPSLLSKDNP
jgi:hypothetical protein